MTPLRGSRESEKQEVRAILLRPLVLDGQVIMPSHSMLHGVIQTVRPVGSGLRRERASMQVAFTHWESPKGERLPVETTLLRIDNAREQVDRRGRIRGIFAANNALGLARGFWLRPRARLMMTAPAGLIGAYGAAWSKFTLGPVGALGIFGVRLVSTRFPDPEIGLPAGTELTLRLQSLSRGSSWGVAADPPRVEPALEEYLRSLPVEVRKKENLLAGDIINIALIGSKTMVEEAFRAAGWVPADPMTRRSFTQSYHALTRRHGYPTAPVSKLTYEGRLPDLVFQKSLNSIAKRHHIRIWQGGSWGGETLWLGAATHDIAVTFERRERSITHRIDPNIDRERDKVMTDLAFVSSLTTQAYVDRKVTKQAGIQTDGALALGWLKPAAMRLEHAFTGTAEGDQTSLGRRTLRRVVLETRHYLLRENPYYFAYLVGRALLTTRRDAEPGRIAEPSIWQQRTAALAGQNQEVRGEE